MRMSFSVVIVTIHGYRFVRDCIASIFESQTPDCEIIVVDNGSHDNTPERLRQQFGRGTQVVEIGKNIGPAAARNAGVARSKGQIIAFLDNDTQVHPEWAVAAMEVFERDSSVGVIQCKLLLANDRAKIDSVGEYIGQYGFLVQVAQPGTEDQGQFDHPLELLAAKSAGMFIRREAFEKAGRFDSDYFIFVEETDLCWRTWLSGYRAVLEPASIVYHQFGGSSVTLGQSASTYNLNFHACKNYVQTLIKNLEVWRLSVMLPAHLVLWMGLAWFKLFRGQARPFLWIHKALAWNVWHARSLFSKRRAVQKARIMPDKDLFSRVMKKRPFTYFLKKSVAKITFNTASI